MGTQPGSGAEVRGLLWRLGRGRKPPGGWAATTLQVREVGQGMGSLGLPVREGDELRVPSME